MNVVTVHYGDIDGVIKKQKESSILTRDRHSKLGPEDLSRKWNLGLQMAKDTLEVTTQHGVQGSFHRLHKLVCM